MSSFDPNPEVPSTPAPAAGEPLPFRVAEGDLHALLAVGRLRLSEHFRVTAYDGDRLIVKHEESRNYLVMTAAQWKALQHFGSGRTVPDVLLELIATRECIPLREFYELVIKGWRRGFLRDERTPPPPPVPPSEWTGRVRGPVARAAALTGLGALIFAVASRPLPPAATGFDLLVACALFAASLSAGNALGASVVVNGGAELYGAGWRWRSWLPRYDVDLWDSVMSGGETVIDAQLARLAPVFWSLTGMAFLVPGATLLGFIGSLLMLSPLWRGPGWAFLHFFRRAPQLDALRGFDFEPNRELRHLVRSVLRRADWRFLGLRAAHTLVWLGLMLLATLLPLQLSLESLWAHYWSAGGARLTALVVASLLGLVAVGAAGLFATLAWMDFRDWWRIRFFRPRVAKVAASGAGLIAAEPLLRQTQLFRAFSDEELAGVARVMQVENYRRGAVVVREGDSGDRLFVVYSGEAGVQRRTGSGRTETIARLGPGEVFGEVALLNDSRRTRSVIMSRGGMLLSLTRENFERLVLSRLSRQEIEASVQKAAFLYRIPLARDWSPAAVTAFASRATWIDFRRGDRLLRQGQENRQFFVLYEGELAVVRPEGSPVKLGVGDFFGEISLLQNSLARASIDAVTDGRCLCIDRDSFLRFVTKDFLVGLFFEDVSSQRLGRPVFLPNGTSYEPALR